MKTILPSFLYQTKRTVQGFLTLLFIATLVAGVQAQTNNSLSFDGINDFVSIPDNDGMSAVTIETWVYWTPANTSDVQFICAKSTEQLEIHAGGIGANGVRFIPVTGVYIDALNVLPTNTWTHIACVYAPAQALAKIYINGQEVTTVKNGPNTLSTAIQNTASHFFLGRRADGTYQLTGSLDEFRLWNKARTAAEILADYNREIDPATQTGLVSYYKFNQGTAAGANTSETTLIDSKGAYNGTLNNFALTGGTSNFAAGFTPPPVNITPDANGIFYIKAGGMGNGSSWAAAAGDLQAAINKAVAGNQIWVAAGTYKPNRKADNLTTITPNNRDNAFVLKKDVKLYGGFAGTETAIAQRDLFNAANKTTLSGDFNGDDGPGYYESETDNAYHVVISIGDVGVAEINGFTVSDGYANDLSNSLTVNGISLKKSQGGGMNNASGSSPIIKNVIFTKNWAYNGGGIFNANSSPFIANTVFSNNMSAVGTSGSAIHNYNNSPVITNCLFYGNYSAVLLNFYASPTITNSTFAANTGYQYGGIYNTSSNPKIYNCIILGNTNGIENVSGSNPDVQNCLVQTGDATSSGNFNGTALANSAPSQIFKDFANGDYNLKAGSNAINKGNNTLYNAASYGDKDLTGKPRIVGSSIDIGAYESQSLINPTAGIVYVKKGGTGNMDGSSWANALAEVADALKYAKDNASSWTSVNPLQIWVAAGVYKPLYKAAEKDNENKATTDRDKAFIIVPNVKLYGGFAGTETAIAQRDLFNAANKTTLSGDFNGDDVITNPGFGAFEIKNNTENAYHVVISAGDIGVAEFDGFNIAGGNAYTYSMYLTEINVNGKSIGRLYGGGINMNTSNLPVRNCNFYGNSANMAGGGLFNVSGSPSILNTIFHNNTSGLGGGGIYNDGSGNANIVNCVFYVNSGTNGGGIVNKGGNSTITNCTLYRNFTDNGGAAYITGGSQSTFNNSIILGNSMISTGVPIYNNGGTYTTNNCIVQTGGITTGGTLNGNTYTGQEVFANTDITAANFLQLKPGSPVINAGSDALYLSTYPAVDLAGNSRISDTAIDLGAYEYQTSPSTGVNELTGQSLTLYPNPTANGFTISAGEIPAALTIHTLAGSLVHRQTVRGKTYVDISALQAGVYTVKIKGKTAKLIKTNEQ